jgi:hypothetical protein
VDEVGETLVRLTEWLWAKRLEPQAIELEEASLEAVYLRLIEEGAGVRGPDGSAPGATEAPAAPEAPDASEKTGTPAEPGAPDAPERWA